MKLSIVSTLYFSSPYIAEFVERCKAAAYQLVQDDYEIILVNDGSPDDSLDVAIALTGNMPKLRVINLSRNFGHHRAMMTGLSYAEGDKVFLLDSDLEEEPELLTEFARVMEAESADCTFGVQEHRRGNWWERFSGNLFYRLFNFLTGFQFPRNVVTARLMTRRFVQSLLEHRERELSIGGLYYITGYNQVPLPIKKHNTSETTYHIWRKLSVFVNSIVSFSSKPLIYVFFSGIAVSFFAFAYVIYTLILSIFFASPPTGWTSLMISVWVLGGLIISSIGVVGIYISKIYEESKQRPYSIVEGVYGQRTEQHPDKRYGSGEQRSTND